jgi:predicted RNA-binding protein with EMAP domain
MRKLLFQVNSGKREYKIYTNGDVSGFGDEALIANYYPELIAQLVAKGMFFSCNVSPEVKLTSVANGALQLTPP